MSEHNESVASFDDFFGTPKNDNVDKQPKQNDMPTSSAIASLIKAQPVVHHRQTPSETKSNINTTKAPLTTNIKNEPTSLPSKSKRVDSPQSKAYESDFDDDTSIDGKQKHSSLPPPKQRSTETPRRGSDSKLKASYTIMNYSIQRKEKRLPYIYPQKRRKLLTKRQPKETKSEVEKRVISAQNDKINQLQSCIAEIRRQLEEERIENRTLRIIQKREEKALKTYEDQEYDIHKVARDYTHEIEHVKEKISNEREIKMKLEKEIDDHDNILRNQTKRIKVYEKLVHEKNLEESDELNEKLKQADKKLKQCQEKIANQEKFIEKLEKNYRHEINQELIKQRDIKHDIENNSKKFSDLLLKFEDKTKQVDTMHIYIQRGGQRPSNISNSLAKSRSLQSLQDTSPQFREKILEYDKKRREQQKEEQKLKPKLKLPLLPINPPPKPERKKYVPKIEPKPKPKPQSQPQPTNISSIPSHIIHDEKPPIIKHEYLPPKEKLPPVRRLSTPKSIDEDKSEIDDEFFIESRRQKSPSPIPPSPKMTQRSEPPLSQATIHKRPHTPVSPPIEPKLNPLKTTVGTTTTTTSNLFKHTEKPSVKRELDDKWSDIFNTHRKEESTKEDLLKLISDEPQERKSTTTTQLSPPSSQRPSMITFEPSTVSTNTIQKKPLPTRITTTNVYDHDQAVINLHEGKPVTAQPSTIKTSVDPFESLFGNNTNKPTNRINIRDESFTTAQDTSDPFESLFDHPSSTANISTRIKPNSRQNPSQNDKLQRPKVVTNVPKSMPNRTVVEDIEEFVL